MVLSTYLIKNGAKLMEYLAGLVTAIMAILAYYFAHRGVDEKKTVQMILDKKNFEDKVNDEIDKKPIKDLIAESNDLLNERRKSRAATKDAK